MIYYGALRLGSPLTSGGEGTLYHVQGLPNLLAKLYHAQHLAGQKRLRKEHKLDWMVTHPPVLKQTTGDVSLAWPTTVLYDGRRQFMGYLMPFMSKASSLLRVWTPIYRRKHLSHFDQRYFFRTARNLCTILSALHTHGYVVGDLNEQNVLVRPDASVMLVGVDSFQVIDLTVFQFWL